VGGPETLRERVLRKLEEIREKVERGAYGEEDLEFLELELSGRFAEIFREWNEEGKRWGFDPSSPKDFADEVEVRLLGPPIYRTPQKEEG